MLVFLSLTVCVCVWREGRFDEYESENWSRNKGSISSQTQKVKHKTEKNRGEKWKK